MTLGLEFSIVIYDKAAWEAVDRPYFVSRTAATGDTLALVAFTEGEYMGLCVVFNINGGKNKFLGREYRENYEYSELTKEDSNFWNVYEYVTKYLDNSDRYGLAIFTSRENAELYIKTDSQKEYLYVMEFDKLCKYIDKQVKRETF